MISSTSNFRRWIIGVIALPCGAFAAWLVATEMLIRTNVEPQDLVEQGIELFYRSESANTIFGDSIAAAGFLPESPGIINLASSGEPMVGTGTKIKGYYRTLTPGRVILAANHTMLGRNLPLPVEYEGVFFKRQRDPLRIMERRHRNFSFRYWHTWLFKDFESRRKILPFGGEVSVEPAADRSFANAKLESRVNAAAQKAISELPNESRQLLSNKAIFEEAVAFLTERGADLCLVSFPMSPAFRLEADRHDAYHDLRRWFAELAGAHGAKYVDFWEGLDADRYFMDPTHLTADGGRIFTALVIPACFGAAFAEEARG